MRPRTSSAKASPSPRRAKTIIAKAVTRRRTNPRVSSRSYAMLSTHITFCIAPLIDQSASKPPIPMIVTPVACPGMIVPSFSISVEIACGPATRLNTPSATRVGLPRLVVFGLRLRGALRNGPIRFLPLQSSDLRS